MRATSIWQRPNRGWLQGDPLHGRRRRQRVSDSCMADVWVWGRAAYEAALAVQVASLALGFGGRSAVDLVANAAL
jgi:hypothetical protein